ncbi:MAG TPA: MFS transporter [Gaiellaceae bacterium]|nr:MFS transporter [Gaiellaceae bacterium]
MLALPPALQQRDFRLLWTSMVASGIATQMAAVAIGWQVYGIHHKAFDLGLIGLAEFAPVPLLALPTGHLADRLSRTKLVAVSTLVEAGVVALLLVVTLGGAHQLWEFIALAAATGAAAQLGNPAARSLTPQIVSPDLLSGAIALRSIGGQAATIGGPAVGGFLFAISPEAVYATAAALLVVAAGTVAAMKSSAPIEETVGAEPALRSLLGGIAFIRGTPVMLGAISLDLFAVLFGGATALLPLYAKSILHTGPFGLGVLRSSIAIGALFAGILLARRPLQSNAGATLLTVVALFGMSMIVFGLSRWYIVSAVALAVSGFVDMISMNIRSMIAAVATPNGLRGRVNAVEGVFIGASNELGAFESGAAAALVGAVPAVVAGGILTVALAGVWRLYFPALSTVDRMEDLAPA